MSVLWRRYGVTQVRLPGAWFTWSGDSGLTIWLHVLRHRWRLWPKPWNFNGPVTGWRARDRERGEHVYGLWGIVHEMSQELTTERRVYWQDKAEEVLLGAERSERQRASTAPGVPDGSPETE